MPRDSGLLHLYLFIFLLCLGVGIAAPTVPLYARSRGASYDEIGLLGAAFALMIVVFAAISGILSDRLGRKKMLLISAATSVLAPLLYLSTRNVGEMILVRLLEGFAWASLWPSLEALTTELAGPAKAGQAMGLSSVAYGASFATGSFLGGGIVSWLGYAFAFVLYSLTALVAAILLVFTIKEAGRTARTSFVQSASKVLPALFERRLAFSYLVGLSYTFVLGTILTFFPVYSKDLGLNEFLVGVLLAFFWSARIVSFQKAGDVSDRRGRKFVIVPSLTAAAVASAMIAFPVVRVSLFAAALIAGASVGAAFPASVGLISDAVPGERRGMAMGVFETFCGAGYLLASTLGGVAAQNVFPQLPYMFSLVLSLGCAATVHFLLREQLT